MRNRVLVLALIAVIALTAGCLKPRTAQPPTTDGTPGPAPVQTAPVLDQAANVYRLAPVAAPSGNGTAWAEIGKSYDEGLTPYTVTYHARLGSIDLSSEAVYLGADEVTGIVWIDASTVMLGGRWLADLTGQGSLTALPQTAWSHQVSPDRTKIAFWGRTNPDDPNSSDMGPQLYDLATGKTQVIKTFTSEDWGFEGEIGVLPLVAWLDGNTLLFDGPRPETTSVFKYNLSTGKTELWREDGWHVCASGDGKYVALAHTNSKGEYSTYVVDMQTGTETELTGEEYAYPTSLAWRGSVVATYNPDAAGIGQMQGGKPVFSQSSRGRVIDVRVSSSGVSYVDVEVKDGQITAMKPVTLTAGAK